MFEKKGGCLLYTSQLDDPTFEKPFFLHTSEQYKTYVMDMAKYAQAGIWPSDAISNTNGITAMFRNGQTVTGYNNYYNGINTLQGFKEPVSYTHLLLPP